MAQTLVDFHSSEFLTSIDKCKNSYPNNCNTTANQGTSSILRKLRYRTGKLKTKWVFASPENLLFINFAQNSVSDFVLFCILLKFDYGSSMIGSSISLFLLCELINDLCYECCEIFCFRLVSISTRLLYKTLKLHY